MTPRTPPLRQSVLATPDSIRRLRSATVEHLRTAGLDAAVVELAQLAVSEAVTNAVLHAYEDAPGPGPIHLAVDVRDATVVVTVADEGGGMAPRMDSPGAGLGLPIIANIATTVEMAHGDRGTRVRMTFAASP